MIFRINKANCTCFNECKPISMLWCLLQETTEEPSDLRDCGLQIFHLYFSTDSDSASQNEWLCHLGPDYWGTKQFTQWDVMHLNSVPFAHFIFTPSLRRLITFIVSLYLLSPQHHLHDTGSNDLLHHRQSTWCVLSWKSRPEAGQVKIWRNISQLILTFFIKVSLCLI